MNEETKKLIGTILAGFAVVAGVLFFYNIYIAPTGTVATLRIEAPVRILENGRLEQLRALYDPDGEGRKIAEDVTKQSVWFAHNPDVVFVSNAVQTKGEALAQSLGEAKVAVSYKGIATDIILTVTEAALGVTCEPSKKTAHVGETVVFVALFGPVGIPDYRYVWSGTDDAAGTAPMLFETYTQPGVKQVALTATDQAGSVANAACSVTVITE